MNLKFCALTAAKLSVLDHPQDVMMTLGIDYEEAIPQSVGDQWWFMGCTGNTESLPEYLKEIHHDK